MQSKIFPKVQTANVNTSLTITVSLLIPIDVPVFTQPSNSSLPATHMNNTTNTVEYILGWTTKLRNQVALQLGSHLLVHIPHSTK